MTSRLVRVASLTIAIAACHPEIGDAQGKVASWLDKPKAASWNKPGVLIPAAPRIQEKVDSRCKEQARPPPSRDYLLIARRFFRREGAACREGAGLERGFGTRAVRMTPG